MTYRKIPQFDIKYITVDIFWEAKETTREHEKTVTVAFVKYLGDFVKLERVGQAWVRLTVDS